MRGWYGEVFENICGKALLGLAVSEGEETLRLELEDSLGERYFKYVTTDGDCCSESWWADITGAKSSYDGIITGVEEVKMPAPNDNRSRQESDIAYGYKITTTKGVIDLVFRNSSNGYYGGTAFDAERSAIYSNRGWVPIVTNDWRA